MMNIEAVVVGIDAETNGRFCPKHIRNGRPLGSRWEATLCVPGTNGGSHTFIQVVAWDLKHGKARGIGTTLARGVKRGDRLKLNVSIISFTKRVFVNGEPVKDTKGDYVVTEAIKFNVKRIISMPESGHERALFSGNKHFGNAKVI